MKRKFAVMLLALAMVFTMGTGVFAANAQGTAAENAYLVKYLKIAEGVTNPNVAFTFHFEGEDGAPAIADQTVTPATKSQSNEDGASVVGSIDLNSVFAGKFTHAGTYHYTVTETAAAEGFTNGTRTTTDENGTVTEKITFSEEEYTVEVRIRNTKDANGNNTLSDPEVTIEKTGGNGDKVDATDEDTTVTEGTDGESTDNTENGTATSIPGFSFTNIYTKTTTKPVDPDPENPEAGLYGAAGITKTVAGDYADQTFAFPFTLTMNAAAGTTDTKVTAKLITGEDVANATSVEITYGEAYDFTLTHGQALVFETLPAGVTYTVTENLKGCGVKDETKYTPAFNGANGTMGTDLSGEITVSDEENAENDGHFTNTVEDDDVTPTGIIINNLPYVLLIALALGGIVIFARKRRYE